MSATTIWPVLHYEEPAAIGRFLTEAFGFVLAAEVRDDAGDTVHVEVRWPTGGAVVIGSTKHREGVHGHLRPGTAATYVECDDVDAVHERAAAAGAEIVQPPQDTAFATGVPTRTFAARDPEGGVWTFGTYRGLS